MPVTSYWRAPRNGETTVSVQFKDAEFERTETVNVVTNDDGTYNDSLTSAAVQDRCVEIEQELADGGGD